MMKRQLHSESERANLPSLLTPAEVATLLRTTKTAVYARIERRQLPGVVRIGRRLLIEESAIVEWLRRNTLAPLLEG